MTRLRRVAGLLNPFQPIRGDFTGAVFLTVVAAWLLSTGIYSNQPGTAVVGAIDSLFCPLGPLAYGLYRRVRR